MLAKEIYNKVRLSSEVIDLIVKLAKEIFGEDVRVWIFGSRADLFKKGGDIDIYLEIANYKDILNKKLNFLVNLEKEIGEQKIDLIVRPLDSEDFISLEAKTTGIRIY
ncbi:MAG: nucleotidyltransferase domain-containing protein [Hydrogenothermaceae bacterium]|nr:nucleotidyltransferase domain-containing protein [Hydrogenothermaceae bacterium]